MKLNLVVQILWRMNQPCTILSLCDEREEECFPPWQQLGVVCNLVHLSLSLPASSSRTVLFLYRMPLKTVLSCWNFQRALANVLPELKIYFLPSPHF